MTSELRNYGESALNRQMRFGTSAWIRGSSPRMTALAGVTDRDVSLDTRPHFRYKRKSRSRKRRQPLTPAGGARAVPAGGGSSPPLPGGFGKTPGRHNDRSATCRWTGIGQIQVTPDDAASPEARSGAELRRWFAAASAAVERRQASPPPCLPRRRERFGGGSRIR